MERRDHTILLLKIEYYTYKQILSSTSKKTFVGIPKIHAFDIDGLYNILLMELLGPSLQSRFDKSPHNRFSIKTTLMLAEQLIHRVQFLHQKDFLYNDIKPDNFVFGRGVYKDKVYIIDFGFAKRYKNRRTKEHIPFKKECRMRGTARFVSIRTHKGFECGRRDDMEAIGYMLVYFAKGSLP